MPGTVRPDPSTLGVVGERGSHRESCLQLIPGPFQRDYVETWSTAGQAELSGNLVFVKLAAIAERFRPKGLVVAEAFRVRITVRGYEIDAQGHLNGVVYLQYGQHARWECLRAAGISQHKLAAAGVAPVELETSIRFHRELRAGDAVEVSCVFVWGDGKTFRVEQDFRRPDGTLVAELANVGGLLNLKQRRLVADPAGQFRSLATAPGVLGLV